MQQVVKTVDQQGQQSSGYSIGSKKISLQKNNFWQIIQKSRVIRVNIKLLFIM